jgi:isocitrate dehydrogenase (NAD+)
MTHRVTLVHGDGVGPEVVEAARRTVEATGVDLAWQVAEGGEAAVRRTGTPWPAVTLDAMGETGVTLKGPIASPVAGGTPNANVALRRALGLHTGVRPCRWVPGVRSRYRDVDLVVVRELAEGMYTGVGFEMGAPETAELIRFVQASTGRGIRPDAGVSIKAISVTASERIARFAFDLARSTGRRNVTAGHKANIMKRSDGVFLETVRRVAEGYPDIAFEDRIIDALTMLLVQAPERFDVLVLPNLYGDLVSELGAGLVGGPGVVPAADLGDGIAVFGTLHGADPRDAGADRADPVAAIRTGAMLLAHLGERDAAERLDAAVDAVIAEGRAVTADLRPSAGDPTAVGTRAMTDAVLERLGV